MMYPGVLRLRFTVALLLMFVVQACSLTPYQPNPRAAVTVEDRAQRQEQGAFVVRASVPSEPEAAQIFDIPIYRRGIQPVWLEISNNSDTRARFIISSVDSEYFAPLEVAYMHKKYFSKQGWSDMEKFLYENAMPRMIGPGKTESGYVFTHAKPGTKSFNVDVFFADSKTDYHQFTFFVEVPGFVPDHADVNFAGLYSDSEIIDTDLVGVEGLGATLPCCTTNRSGTGQGQPVNVALVGNGPGILRALLRAGWSQTSYEKNDIFLNNSYYYFDRPPDATFKISRGKTTERNELSLWLAPVRVDGEPLWMGLIKHAIGRRFEITETFLGTALDPNVDDGRNFLLQNLWYSHSLRAFAYSDSGKAVSPSQPVIDFKNNPFFTDGLRIVMWISGQPVALNDVQVHDTDFRFGVGPKGVER